MLNADENNPIEKSGERKRKSGKRNKKTAEQPVATLTQELLTQELDPKPDQVMDAQVQDVQDVQVQDVQVQDVQESGVPFTSADSSATDAPVTEAALTSPAVSAEATAVNLQTIANAYGDYTKKSFEQTSAFFEKLAGVRSLDKALELQGEFAREACDTFIAEWQKIGELHSELAKQRFKRFEGFVDRMTQTALPPMGSAPFLGKQSVI